MAPNDKRDDSLAHGQIPADEYSARVRDRGDPLLGHRERVMYLLSVLAIVAFVPFAINNFVRGRYALGGAIVATLLVFMVNAVAIHFKRHPPIPFILLLPPLCAAMTIAFQTQGIHGAFWSYPVILFFYFIMPRGTATFASIVLFIFSTGMVAYYVSVDVAIRFSMALALTIIIINVILNVIVRLQDKLLDQSIRDPLTSAFNRRHMQTCLNQSLEHGNRNGTPASVLLFDIDHFKRINDQFGHAAGDQVLCGIVTLLEARLRKIDFLFRIGGEEFILLLTETQEADAVLVAEDVRARVAAAPLYGENLTSVSIGVTGLRSSDSVDSWIRRADDALYKAKAAGRDRVVTAG
ncbi:MAG: GGDEF domain-containing protein [Betaproteobacteria bacterium]